MYGKVIRVDLAPSTPQTLHGTAMHADQLGWCQGGQFRHIYIYSIQGASGYPTFGTLAVSSTLQERSLCNIFTAFCRHMVPARSPLGGRKGSEMPAPVSRSVRSLRLGSMPSPVRSFLLLVMVSQESFPIIHAQKDSMLNLPRTPSQFISTRKVQKERHLEIWLTTLFTQDSLPSTRP